MTMEYDGVIAVGTTIVDAITHETNGEILALCSGDNTLRRYDTTTRTQNGSSASVFASAKALCLVDNASAAVSSSSASTIDLVEISSGYKQNYSGGATGASTIKSQNSAGDIGNKIALFVTSVSKRLAKFNGNTFTLSTVDVEMMTNDQIKSIVYKSADRFLIGTDGGRVYEIDSNGNIYRTVSVTLNPHGVTGFRTATNFPLLAVYNMTIDNNLVLMSTKQGTLHLWDWSTGTELLSQYVGGGSTTGGLTLSPSASGIAMAGRQYDTQDNNTVFEMDFTIEPIRVGTVFYADSTNTVVAAGIHESAAKGWAAITSANDIHVFSLTPRGSVVRTISSPGSVPAELVVLSDNGSRISVAINTSIDGSGNYRVPAGVTIYEMLQINNGSTASWSGSKYTT